MEKAEKFTMLSFDAFSKEELTDNKLRSINGGGIPTCHGVHGRDILLSNGLTGFGDLGNQMEVDVKSTRQE